MLLNETGAEDLETLVDRRQDVVILILGPHGTAMRKPEDVYFVIARLPGCFDSLGLRWHWIGSQRVAGSSLPKVPEGNTNVEGPPSSGVVALDVPGC
jgi:hypothetical protein